MNQHDPYSNCPCGSGRKLKFCCGDILQDLMRFYRLEENQPEAAEKMLRDLNAKFPFREVVVGELVRWFRQHGDPQEARLLLTGFLKKYPDHPRGLIWMTGLLLQEDGFFPTRRLLHRTLQICSRSFPEELAEFCDSIGLHLVTAGNFMSGREHLALAARLVGSERGRSYLMHLAMLESDSEIPYPLRMPYSLLPVSGSEELQQQDLRARKLSLIGCWEPAGILYSRMADSDPQNGAVWYNLGLCRAWDAREAEAAVALHEAARLLPDFDLATEVECLAQVLDQTQPENQYRMLRYLFPVRSASELLNRLSGLDTFIRMDDSELEEVRPYEVPAGMELVAALDQLDSPPVATPWSEDTRPPEVIGELELLDIVDEAAAEGGGNERPLLQLLVLPDQMETALPQLRQACGDLLLIDDQQPVEMRLQNHALDARDLELRIYMPSEVPRHFQRVLLKNRNQMLSERWLRRPLQSLGGRTPLEVAEDPAMKIPLAAAVLTFWVNARLMNRMFNLSDMRKRLRVPEPASVVLPEGQHCAAHSGFYLERMDCSRLNDQQIQEYCNRAAMIGFSDLTRTGLDELLRRSTALEQFGIVRACLMRAAIARSDNDLTTLTACTDRARTAAAAGKEGFRELLEIEIRELAMRLEDPTDPELIPLLHRLRDRYLPKLPEIADVVHAQLLSAGCSELIAELTSVVSVGSAESGHLWTPDAPLPRPEGSSGLWLPGQS